MCVVRGRTIDPDNEELDKCVSSQRLGKRKLPDVGFCQYRQMLKNVTKVIQEIKELVDGEKMEVKKELQLC